jgi:predicted CoA-binding protein
MKSDRPSHRVGAYLASVGYRVIPVNTGHVGRPLFGETVVGRLADIKGDVQLVNIFRNSDDVLPVVEEALTALSGLRFIWMQLDIQNAEARRLAEEKGVLVFENRCTASEHRRLLNSAKSA